MEGTGIVFFHFNISLRKRLYLFKKLSQVSSRKEVSFCHPTLLSLLQRPTRCFTLTAP